MKKLLSIPLLLSLLALLSGAGSGAYWYWRASSVIVAHFIEEQEKVVPPAPELGKGWDFWTIEIENLATELREERSRLRYEAEQANQRNARLEAEQQQLAALRSEIEQMQSEISDRVVEIRTDEKKNIRTLALAYTNLSPDAAIALIRELDDVTVVKILSQMKPDVIGPIFEEMSKVTNPDNNLARRAAILSEKLRLVRSASPQK